MKELLFIAFGGSIGAVLRYLLSNMVYNVMGRSFPYGTLSVNILGSFLMGLSFVLLTEKLTLGSETRSFIIVGLLGAFTTFSTFSMETLFLLQYGNIFKAILNIFLSVILCLIAAWAGLILAKNI